MINKYKSDLDSKAIFLNAAGEGKLDVVRAYINNGGDPNAMNDFNATALIFAASYNKIEIVDYLLSVGANPQLTNKKGSTPLEISKYKNNHELINIFRKYDPNIVDPKQELMLANKEKNKNDQFILDTVRGKVVEDINNINRRIKSNQFGGADDFSNSILSGKSFEEKRKLNSIYDKPFFGRIDFINSNNHESYYVGKFDYQNLIISNNNKVAKIFYQKKIGTTIHETLGRIKVELIRQFEIKNGKITSFNDLKTNSVQFTDPILQKRLEENSSSELQEVVETIQEEQYGVISADEKTPLIVQGSAGSGKTTIALQRLSYLIYNNKDLKPSDTVIFGPNRMFINYIKNVLPDIGVNGILQTTFSDWFKDNVVDKDKIHYTINSHTDLIETMANSKKDIKLNAYRRNKQKGNLGFKGIISKYLKDVEKEFNPVKFSNVLINLNNNVKKQISKIEEIYSVNLSIDKDVFEDISKRLDLLYNDYNYLPLLERRKKILTSLENDRKAFFKKLTFNSEDNIKSFEHERQIKNINKMISKWLAFFEKLWEPVSSFELYFNLIGDVRIFSKYVGGGLDLEELQNFTNDNKISHKNKKLESSDLAGIYMIDDFLYNGLLLNKTKKYDYIIIDEGQDFNAFEINLLSKIVKKGKMTVLGDLGQSIYESRSIKLWEELNESIYESIDLKSNYIELSTSYRSTNQITNFSNNIISEWSKGKYNLSKPFGRDGREPLVKKGLTGKGKIQEVESQVDSFKMKSHKNIAILVRNKEDVNSLRKQLLNIKDINVYTDDSEDYEGGVIIMPVLLSKGMEFDCVIVYDEANYNIDENNFDKKLFYVACTRALHDLVIL